MPPAKKSTAKKPATQARTAAAPAKKAIRAKAAPQATVTLKQIVSLSTEADVLSAFSDHGI